MGFDVKITTFFSPLDLIAPFTCRGCGRLGGLLCGCCKNYNTRHLVGVCPRCGLAHKSKGGKACKCKIPVYAATYREGVMMRLVEDYKYKSIRATAGILTEFLDAAIPRLDKDTVVVPLPTIGRHIRERGFDHTWLLARKLAKHRGFEAKRILERRNKTVQVGANEVQRQKQAKKAYKVAKRVDVKKAYLLVDDVWTTGASMEAAILAMKKAGAKKIAAAVILMPRR